MPRMCREEESSAAEPWIEAARGGCRDSLSQAVEACRQYLLLIASREIHPALRSRGGASDLVQETLLVAHHRFDQFAGGSEAELRAWLRQILRNKLLQFRRDHSLAACRGVGREVPLDLHQAAAEAAEERTSASEILMRGEQLLALQRAVDQLPDPYRQVFCWRHQDGCAHEEIGRRLGISTDAARKTWARAIERLQAMLGPLL